MAKVLFIGRGSKSRPANKLVVKRVRDNAGRLKSVTIVNAESNTLPSDLESLFTKNVLKVRRANKMTLGTSGLGAGPS